MKQIKFRKIVAIILCISMILSMNIWAYADGDDVTETTDTSTESTAEADADTPTDSDNTDAGDNGTGNGDPDDTTEPSGEGDGNQSGDGTNEDGTDEGPDGTNGDDGVDDTTNGESDGSGEGDDTTNEGGNSEDDTQDEGTTSDNDSSDPSDNTPPTEGDNQEGNDKGTDESGDTEDKNPADNSGSTGTGESTGSGTDNPDQPGSEPNPEVTPEGEIKPSEEPTDPANPEQPTDPTEPVAPEVTPTIPATPLVPATPITPVPELPQTELMELTVSQAISSAASMTGTLDTNTTIYAEPDETSNSYNVWAVAGHISYPVAILEQKDIDGVIWYKYSYDGFLGNWVDVFAKHPWVKADSVIVSYEGFPEECQEALKAFEAAMTIIPAVEDITAFDTATNAFAEAHMVVERDSVLPEGSAEAYKAAFDSFANAMNMSGEALAYPDTTLTTALNKRIYTALSAYYDAMDAYDGNDFDAALSNSTQLQNEKTKLDALLTAKPDLQNPGVSLLSTDSDTVQKVDTVSENIQMHLFNYGPLVNTQQLDCGFLPFTHSEGTYGWAVDNAGNAPAGSADGWPHLNTKLSSFPYIDQDKTIIKKGSLTHLFDPSWNLHIDLSQYNENISSRGAGNSSPYQYHSAYFPINNENGSGTGLFQKEDNYYVYDSGKNAAWYNQEKQKFEIYNYVVRPAYTAYSTSSTNGNFLPFNQGHTQGREDYQSETEVRNYEYNDSNGNMVEASSTVAKNDTVITKPSGATATAYRLWGNNSSNEVDLWFGMNMEFDFYQPENGRVDDEDMVFEFLGDDDVWVYIDDILILDIGGTHGAVTGTINFATGLVTNPTNYGQYGTNKKSSSTLYELMKEALGDQLDESKFTDSDNDGTLDTFANFEKLNLKFYYLERGGNISYCKLKFNIEALPDAPLAVTKDVKNLNEIFNKENVYQFQLLQDDNTVMSGAEFTVTDPNKYTISNFNQVVSTNDAGITTYKTNDSGYFYLKDNQTAYFSGITVGNSYIVKEIVTDTPGYTTACTVNGVQQQSNQQTDTIIFDTTDDKLVTFTNTWNTTDLTLTKEIADEVTGETGAFEFTVTIDEDDNNNALPYTGTATKTSGETTETVAITDGKISLKQNESITIADIPIGTAYSISETKPVNTIDTPFTYRYREPLYKVNDNTANEWKFDTATTDLIIVEDDNTVTVTNRCIADLKITKTGADEKIDPNQTFIFTVKEGDKLITTVTIHGNGEAIIKDLHVGTEYTVTEDENWSWRYTPDAWTKTIILKADTENAVTFTNARDTDKWIDGNTWCQNIFDGTNNSKQHTPELPNKTSAPTQLAILREEDTPALIAIA